MENLDRFTRAWAVALFLIGAGLCFIPLFNLLGYEFAFAVGVPLAFCGGAVGVRARRRQPDAPWTAWVRAMATTTGLAATPLIPITLNALRVRNCDYLEGLAFYAVLTLVTGVVSTGWGVAIARFAPRRGFLLFVFAALTTLGLTLARVWYDPPVDAFHPLFGYYPGPIYDAVVEIDLQLIASERLFANPRHPYTRALLETDRSWLEPSGDSESFFTAQQSNPAGLFGGTLRHPATSSRN